MSSPSKSREFFGFEVSHQMRREYQKAYGKFDLSFSSAMRQALRGVLEIPAEKRVEFVEAAQVNDAKDKLVAKGIWDQVKAHVNRRE